MSLSILLLGWVAVSLLLSPVIGRFMARQDDSEARSQNRQTSAGMPASVRIQAPVRRNVAIQLSRRDTSWPRIG